MDPATTDPTHRPSRQRPGPWAWLTNRGFPRLGRATEPARARRLLFLDDDPFRAEVFLKDHPDATWVTTVADCVARLAQEWDEVHLDHDLGGKTFVDIQAEDCGMEVIRWLCKEPRGHLKETLFFVHTHNAAAGLLMVLEMRGRGYQAEFRPFGLDLARLLSHNEPPSPSEAAPPSRPARRTPHPWLGWIRRSWPGFRVAGRGWWAARRIIPDPEPSRTRGPEGGERIR